MPHRASGSPEERARLAARSAPGHLEHDLVTFDAASPDDRPPVRIFVGTEDGQWRAERVLLWSIDQVRDPSRRYEIHLLKNLAGFRDGAWLTGFTNYRFLLPHLTSGQGRAIYNDVDQIYLRDPALLFDLDMHGAGYLSINECDTSVMLMDTERMLAVWPLERVKNDRRKSLERRASAVPGLWRELDGGWNARDTEYEPGRSSLVHFTTIHTQPWMPFPRLFTYQHNPVGSLWFELERSAEAAAFHVFSEAHPSLQYRKLIAGLRGGTPPAPDEPCADECFDLERALAAVDASSVLEYGIGTPPADRARRESHGRHATRYDPASRPLDKQPAEVFDAVVFTRGLELVPDADLPWLIDGLFALARQAIHVALDADVPNPNGSRAGWARDRFFWSGLFATAAARHPAVDWRVVAHTGKRAARRIAWARGRGWKRGGAPHVWVLTDDKAGHTNQSIGLANSLGFPYETRRMASSRWSRLSNRLLGSTLLGVSRDESEPLDPPWPDLVITTGRRCAPVARWIAKQSRGHARIVQIGRKGADMAEGIDLGVTCAHFRLLPHRRRIETTTPINGITDETLASARERWRSLVSDPSERPVVLIAGGASPHHEFDAAAAKKLGEQVVAFAAGRPVLAITSPRTGAAAEDGLEQGLAGAGHLHRFGGGGDANPYLGYLASAAAIVATGESESMLGEAVATGVPVYIYPIADKRPRRVRRLSEWVRAQAHARPKKLGKGSVRPQAGRERFFSRVLASGVVRLNRDLAQFHRDLVAEGVALMWGAPLDTLSRRPLREVERVAARVREMLSLPAAPGREQGPALRENA